MNDRTHTLASRREGQGKRWVSDRVSPGRVREPEHVRLLLVEDDPTISDPLLEGLRREGFEVELAATGRAALAAPPVDLVLLDLGLPDLEGRVVCQELRKASNVPIIVVTARSDEIDRVVLLELGADDYVVKPFGFRELVARIRAVLRRVGQPDVASGDAEPVVVGELVVDRRRHAVSFDGAPIALTPKEYELLLCLALDAGAVKTREQLMREVWDEHWWGSTKTLDVHIASLRRKLTAEVIETVRSVGYVYRAATEPDPPGPG